MSSSLEYSPQIQPHILTIAGQLSFVLLPRHNKLTSTGSDSSGGAGIQVCSPPPLIHVLCVYRYGVQGISLIPFFARPT